MQHAHQGLRSRWSPLGAALVLSLFATVAYPGVAAAADLKVTLTGDQEVPPVKSAGSAAGTITINDDMSVSGSVKTTGIVGTMAHIHEAAAGKNGPVIVKLQKDGDAWSVPAGTKLTAAQFASFKAGDLYVNVHTAENPKGEMRAQLKP
jgi:hypothetical protein